MLELTRQSLLTALSAHVGRENGVTGRKLVVEICGAWSAGAERELRKQVQELRDAGIAVCADPAAGYHIARDYTELQLSINFLCDRIRTTAHQVRQLKRLAAPDLNGQRRLLI